MRKFIPVTLLLLLWTVTCQEIHAQACMLEEHLYNENETCNDNPWVLVLNEEFNGNQLDLTKWTPKLLGGHVNHANLYSYFLESNAAVNNGKLNLMIDNTPVWGFYDEFSNSPDPPDPGLIMPDGLPNYRQFPYSVSAVTSRYRYDYGRFEIMCRLPDTKGFWPAFWLHFSTDEYPQQEYNEIDIFEFWNYNYSRQCITIHHDSNSGNGGCQECINGPNFAAAQHKFAVEWDQYEMRFYTDDILVRHYPRYLTFFPFIFPASCELLNIGPTVCYRMKAYPADAPMYIIANTAIDNRHNGIYLPDGNTEFPNKMEVEYIKCWMKKPCSGDIALNDLNQFDLSYAWGDKIMPSYNIQTGGRIETTGSNMFVPELNQLELRASQSITINPGFSCQKKANLLFHIDPQLCNSGQRLEGPPAPAPATPEISDKLIRMYPNPSTGKFKVVSANPLNSLEVYDAQGRMVLSEKSLDNEQEIDLSQFPNGIYYIRAMDVKENTFSGKLILQQ